MKAEACSTPKLSTLIGAAVVPVMLALLPASETLASWLSVIAKSPVRYRNCEICSVMSAATSVRLPRLPSMSNSSGAPPVGTLNVFGAPAVLPAKFTTAPALLAWL